LAINFAPKTRFSARMLRFGCSKLGNLRGGTNKRITSAASSAAPSTFTKILVRGSSNRGHLSFGGGGNPFLQSQQQLPSSRRRQREFDSLSDILNRVRYVTNADSVSKVNASFVIDFVTGEGRFFIDLTNGDGLAGFGDLPHKPKNYRPDVHIKISRDTCLKVFNNELPPTTAFMTGKMELVGDMTKLLSLDRIFKATQATASVQASTHL